MCEERLLRLFLRIALLAGLTFLRCLLAALVGAFLARGLRLVAAALAGNADVYQEGQSGHDRGE
jgi:hypothetical protein